MLHVINKAPGNSACVSECLRVCGPAAQILLIEDGIYAALSDQPWVARLLAAAAGVHVLEADARARGVLDRVDSAVVITDDAGFVQLCIDHGPVQSWY